MREEPVHGIDLDARSPDEFAASLLRSSGIDQVSDLIGGYNAWTDHQAA
ncbi:hypothetical protein [Nocardia fluminea]